MFFSDIIAFELEDIFILYIMTVYPLQWLHFHTKKSNTAKIVPGHYAINSWH